MESIIYNIELDIKNTKDIQPITIKKGDIATHLFKITIKNEAAVYNLTDTNVSVIFVNGENKVTVQSEDDETLPVTVVDDVIDCIIRPNVLAATGKTIGEVVIRDNEGRRLASPSFSFHVTDALYIDDIIKAMDDFPIIDRLLLQLKDLSQQHILFNIAESERDSSEECRKTNEIAREVLKGELEVLQETLSNIETTNNTMINNAVAECQALSDSIDAGFNTYKTNLTADFGNHKTEVMGLVNNITDDLVAHKEEYALLEDMVTNVIDNDITNVLNNELIATDIANKLNAKEVEYAPRLTSVETQLADMASHLVSIADFPIVIPESDDTGRFTRALAKLENNGIFKVPDGEYLVSLVTISNKKNCQFFFTGTIKAKDGVDESRVVAITNCDGSIFYGLNIDGNRDNVVNRGITGDQPCLVIGSYQKDITFVNTTISNSIMCGVVSNGGCENIKFEKTIFNNIGEHCFYISGGGNKNWRTSDTTVNSFGMNNLFATTNHECAVSKVRITAFGSNEDIYYDGLNVTKGVGGTSVKVLFYFVDIIGFEGKNIYSDATLCIVTGTNVLDVKFDNITIPFLFHSVTGTPNFNGISIKNSRITGSSHSLVNLLKNIDNCLFTGSIYTNEIPIEFDNYKTVFNKCQFTTGTSTANYQCNLIVVDRDIEFVDCEIIGSQPEAIVANNLINIGQTSIKAGTVIRFINTTINSIKWLYSMQVFGVIPIEFKGGSINRRMRASENFGNILLDGIKLSETEQFAFTPTQYTQIKVKNLDQTTKNRDKLNGTVGIATGVNASAWVSLLNFVFLPKAHNIKATLLSAPSGITNYWVEYDSVNSRFRINTVGTSTATVTFGYEVFIYDSTQ